MITLRISTEVNADRQIMLTLPPEVPIGKADLVITVASAGNQHAKQPRTSLADWAEQNAENWGTQLNSEDVDGFTGRRF